MSALPTDVILHILSFTSLCTICKVLNAASHTNEIPLPNKLTNHYLESLCKQEIISRAKRERWNISFYTPSAYLEILGNRETALSLTPVASLNCKGYCSQAEYLRFEEASPTITRCYLPLQLTEENEFEFQSMKIYCSRWINIPAQDGDNEQIKLAWRVGDQIKQITEDLCICYRCSVSSAAQEFNCSFCTERSRCNRHAFTSFSSSTKSTKQIEIIDAYLSLKWLLKGLVD
ncbi:hypothetical protein BDF20DRAFT_922148 [Mycotypha africana]|uniref:uncharacterized protein n=1 Tax=Mycotypha africana TaxID=64632 RepID=UPI0023009DC1|nr:uncharacterized protein BDF20DRAFT_922148 [Mycotypha africana]KAI8969906.1 hypothetical protein BDF20DRAFT_922148 [Mycotypha africana]